MSKRALIFLILVFSIVPICDSKPYPRTIEARVIEVIDGNTIRFEDPDGGELIIVLEYADSPEEGQNGYREAKQYLEKRISNKKVSISIKGKDRYGNLVGQVKTRGKDVGTQLVSNGLAWATTKAPESVKSAQNRAQSENLGIWASDENEAPWIYKRKATLNLAKSS